MIIWSYSTTHTHFGMLNTLGRCSHCNYLQFIILLNFACKCVMCGLFLSSHSISLIHTHQSTFWMVRKVADIVGQEAEQLDTPSYPRLESSYHFIGNKTHFFANERCGPLLSNFRNLAYQKNTIVKHRINTNFVHMRNMWHFSWKK